MGPREIFKTAAENMVLPAFVIRDGKDWRLVSYEADMLRGCVGTRRTSLRSTTGIESRGKAGRGIAHRAGGGVGGIAKRCASKSLAAGGAVQLDFAYAAGHLLDVVPNPWIGYEFVERVFAKLLAKWKGKEKVVANNLVFILEELRKQLEAERDRLAEEAFNRCSKGRDAVHGGRA